MGKVLFKNIYLKLDKNIYEALYMIEKENVLLLPYWVKELTYKCNIDTVPTKEVHIFVSAMKHSRVTEIILFILLEH